jgi:outer membrane protein TolC
VLPFVHVTEEEMRIHVVIALLMGLAAAGKPAAQVLDFAEAMRLAETRSARLAAQRHSVDAAREQIERSRELPDPKLKVGIENLPLTGVDRYRYDRDFMTARRLGWMQEFPNESKRAARGERAARARDVEQAGLAAQGVMLHKEVAMAWFDAHFADRMRTALERLAGQFDLQTGLAATGLARGRLQAVESYALRSAHEQANDRVIEAQRVLARARIALGAWLGDDARRPLGAAPDTSRLLHAREALVEQLARHPSQRVFAEREALAQAEVELARAGKIADWSLEVGYGQRRPYFENQISVQLSIELPMLAERRQDRDIASRLAELERVRAEREDARRMHEAEVRGALADFDSAQRRVERFERILLPLALERRELSLAAYRGARAELAPVLEAERNVTETELAFLQAQAERAKAWATLSFLEGHGETK